MSFNGTLSSNHLLSSLEQERSTWLCGQSISPQTDENSLNPCTILRFLLKLVDKDEKLNKIRTLA